MSRDHIEGGLPWKWTPERVARAIRTPYTNVAIARNEIGLLGFGIMAYMDSVAHLTLLAIRDDHRRRGLGAAIVEWLEKVARTAGVELIRVEARADNVAALALYAAFGYRQRERVAGMYYGIDDGIRLEKVLSIPNANWLASFLEGSTNEAVGRAIAFLPFIRKAIAEGTFHPHSESQEPRQ